MTRTLVTGGTGFIGLHVIKLLLEHGHHVNTTVRSLDNPSKIQALVDLQAQFPGHLDLFEADLLKIGSFHPAMKDVDVVHHVASPFLIPSQIKDGIKECIEPAVQGTKNVLTAVNDTPSVTRVVLTSSIVAIYGDNADILKMKGATLSEDYWNETSTPSGNPYGYSKMAAEREAWKMQEMQSRWSLVAINPGLVVGPSLSPTSVSGSLVLLENMYRGTDKMGVPELHYPIADVREVADAHVKAGENPAAHGRYIIATRHSISLLDMANFVRPVHQNPSLLPTRNLPKLMVYAAGPFIGLSWKWVLANIGIGYKVDHNRSVKELGIVYRPMEETVRSHYTSWLSTAAAKK